MTDRTTTPARRKAAVELELKELELEKARVELGYLKAERATKEAEKREKIASARKAEVDADLREFDAYRHKVGYGLTADTQKGVFRLESDVYERVLELTAVIERFAAANPGHDIVLHIFSPGGSVMHGLALYDLLRTLSARGHKITTLVRGFCGSMASVIFLAGDERLIGAESIIHQHEPAYWSEGKASELSAEAQWVQRLYDKITRIYVSRTGMTRQAFRAKTLKKEWYAEADEAVRLGIATQVG